MKTYENDLTNYEKLIYFKNGKLTPNDFMINLQKCTMIDKNNKFVNTCLSSSGYLYCSVLGITRSLHRIIYEHAHKRVINDANVIDHINNDKCDNHITNLQEISQRENCKKSTVFRDYSFNKHNYQHRRKIIATDTKTGIKNIFPSAYTCQQFYNINAGIILNVCKNSLHSKSGTCKKNNHKIKFCFANDDEPITMTKQKIKDIKWIEQIKVKADNDMRENERIRKMFDT